MATALERQTRPRPTDQAEECGLSSTRAATGSLASNSRRGIHLTLSVRVSVRPMSLPCFEPPPPIQLHPLDEVGLVNDLTHNCRPSAPDYNVVGAPVAGSIGVVADDVELVEPGVAESVNESTWS
jgi:hypothetical protein